MKKSIITTLLMLLSFTCVATAQTDMGALLATVDRVSTNALVTVRCSYETDSGPVDVSGMGVCYDADGEFITLMFDRVRPEKISNLRLVLPGVEQKSIEAEFLGMVPGTGVSFIKATEKHNWQAIRFADSADLRVGQAVASAGLIPNNPAGVRYFGGGYVSAAMQIPETIRYITGGRLTCVGSPVFRADGQAIGIISKTLFLDYQVLTSRGVDRLGMKGQQETPFFMPVDEFGFVFNRIPRDGTVSRVPWIGVLNYQGIESEQASLMGLDRPGVQIDNIIPGAAAHKAGLQTGDVIVALNGESLEKLATAGLIAKRMLQRIERMVSGQTVTLRVLRGGTESDVSLVLTEAPMLPAEAERYSNGKLGLRVREKVAIDQYLDKSPTAKLAGMPVIAVGTNSPAADGGLQSGDLVTAVNGQPANTVGTFKQIIEDSLANDPTKSIILLIRRGDQEPQAISIQPLTP